MATVSQMMPLSGQPNRFSFHIESNEKTTQVRPRNTTISHRLKAIIVSWTCTRSICSWTASVSFLSGRLVAACRAPGLAGLPYQLALEAVL